MEAKPAAESLGAVVSRIKAKTSNEEPRPLKVCDPNPRAMEDVMGKWGVFCEYQGWTLAEFGIETPLDWSDGGFLLTGIQGCGKSCLAGAILSDRMQPEHPQTLARQEEKGYSTADGYVRAMVWTWAESAVAWYYALELPRRIMDSWGREREASAMREVLRHKVIVIDDLGSEKSTEHTIPIMREVVERCVNDGIDLIVTTNMSWGDLAKRDARLASRLSRLSPIELPERDMRVEAYRRKKKIQAKPCGFEKARL